MAPINPQKGGDFVVESQTGFPGTSGTVHGYCRCSTNEDKQDIGRQVRELKARGASVIWQEFEHGDSAVKAQQVMMFEAAKPGDTIIVLEVSRLARSTRQLCDIVDMVQEKQLRLEIVGSITLDCRDGNLDPMSAAFVQMSGVFAQLELSLIRARVRSGMANAKAKGVRLGRPPICAEGVPERFLRYYPGYLSGKYNMSELARLTGYARTTCYRYAKAMEDG